MKITSIFESIDGEVNGFNGAGQLTTFVRLAGCNLRCSYCDTSYSWDMSRASDLSVEEILKQIQTPHVTVTGGEPLLQPTVVDLFGALKIQGKTVTVETNGTIPTPKHDVSEDRVRYVVDCKLSSSGQFDPSRFREVYKRLTHHDVVKFVVGDERDLKDCLFIKAQLRSWTEQDTEPKRAYSPIWNRFPPDRLVEWIKMYDKVAQLSLQLHKIIWPNAKEER